MMKPPILPIGAEPSDGGTRIRVWAPAQRALAIMVDGQNSWQLHSDNFGYYTGEIPGLLRHGLYQLQLDSGELIPDPASRFQPAGPDGPSQVIDARDFPWSDHDWIGRPLEDYVIYEMHVGTFTSAGTWRAAISELNELASIGMTCIEVMPVAEFSGRWGWGYDGVGLYAPFHEYGTPDDFRAFVDAAHRAGICVILDVVYNHFGPDGNHFRKLSPAYFSTSHTTDWGEALNFDGLQSAPVREFILSNAVYWIREFHLDGLRLDATQDIYDDSPRDRHILTELGRQVRAAAPHRTLVLISENEPQQSDLGRTIEEGGYGLDAMWNDDFHHTAMVALTGHREAYYRDYRGDPQEFVSAAKYGYLYQGQWYSWQRQRRGQPGFDLAPHQFISFIQNHDQVANSGRGERAHQLGNPGTYRALTALMLLGPATPMFFQGQEFGASTPFLYFIDHKPELARLVEQGRREFLRQFRSLNDPMVLDLLAKPDDPETFQRCKLDFSERRTHAPMYQLTKDLLSLRRHDPCFRESSRRGVDGAVLGPEAFVLRYFMNDGRDRLLLVNLGRDLDLSTAPEPLLGADRRYRWSTEFSTDSAIHGGRGIVAVESDNSGWYVSGESAVFMSLVPDADPPSPSQGTRP